MKTTNIKHTAKSSALKTAPLTSVVLGILVDAQVSIQHCISHIQQMGKHCFKES
jgi:hypothetical protein